MIVVDLGSQVQEGHDSVALLIERFQPEILHAFDPLAESHSEIHASGTFIDTHAVAAWTYDGVASFGVGGRGMDATLIPEKKQCGEWQQTRLVLCIDFSDWLKELNQQIILKMDVEGAEYMILEKMLHDRTDLYVDRLLVEWHDHWMGNPEAFTHRRYSICDHFNGRWEGWQ